MDQLIDKLLSDSYFKKDAINKLKLLREYVNFSLFTQTDAKTQSDKFEQFKASYKNEGIDDQMVENFKWIGSLGEIVKLFNPQKIDSQFSQLEKSIQDTKTVIVYLPMELNLENYNFSVGESSSSRVSPQIKIGRWIKENVDKKMIFDVAIDPSLIGGCALSLNGVYKDFSLKAKIEENKAAILKSLTEYKGKS